MKIRHFYGLIAMIVVLALPMSAAGPRAEFDSHVGSAIANLNREAASTEGAVRLAGLIPSDVWAKAGLMARETLDAGSRFAAVLATPAMAGSLFEWRDTKGNASQTSGSFPVNHPNTWLRLQRCYQYVHLLSQSSRP